MGLFTRKPKGSLTPIREAGGAAGEDWTPSPLVDDWATNQTSGTVPLIRIFQDYPEGAFVEWLFLYCDEWADVVQKLVSDVWRGGLQVVPVHDLLCGTCGEPVDDPTKACAFCGDTTGFREPDPRGRLILEEFLAKANDLERHSLDEVGARKTEEMLKHGRGYLAFKNHYSLQDDGRIAETRLMRVKAASSARIVRLRRKDGSPGGKWICIDCRGTHGESYKPEDQPGPCSRCRHRVTYEAHYAELVTPDGQKARTYYLPNEILETAWPYRDGSPPIRRLENKALFLVFADFYAAMAVHPDTPSRPDRILVTMGGDEQKVWAWAKRDAKERQKNPQKLSHLHIPSPPGGLDSLKMSAMVLDLGDVSIKGNMPKMREDFTHRIRAHYGGSPVQGGDVQGGGLNSEGLQLRVRSMVVQDLQGMEGRVLGTLARKLGVMEWTYRFPPPLEEDEGRNLDVTIKGLQAAGEAAKRGLRVRWVDGKPRIQDGDVTAPDDEVFQPLGAAPERSPPSMTAPPIRNAHKLAQLLRQAGDIGIDDAGDLIKSVQERLLSPDGAEAAEAFTFSQYADLSAEASQGVQRQIVEAMTTPGGWSITGVAKTIQKAWQVAGLDELTARNRARLVARMETRSVSSQFKRLVYKEEESRRGEKFRYTVRGASDFRTTKLSYWVREQIPAEGVEMEQLESLLDQAVDLAKAGAFAKGGQHAGARGQPIQLPTDFRRRGWIIHFNDRDSVVRVV